MIIVNLSVLSRGADSVGSRQPTPEGRAVWSMLFNQYMGRILVVSDEDYDRSHFSDWLKMAGYKASSFECLYEPLPDLKAQRIHLLGAAFGKIEWYVDSDPKVCAETTALGIPTMLISVPFIIRPEWDKEREIRQWDTLVEEMETQALKAAERTWRE